MKNYNGHRSWNAWNVSLWINNDESLYNLAVEKVEKAKKRYNHTDISIERQANCAARWFFNAIGGNGAKTPDGAKYNVLSIKNAIIDIF